MEYLNQQSVASSPVIHQERLAAKPKRPRLNKEGKKLQGPVSKRSGGPKTPDGKSKSAQNSTKHGGYVIPSRGSEEFCKFEQGVHGYLEPDGVIEVHLASRIASTLWQSKLIQRYVHEGLDAAEFDDVSLKQLALITNFPFVDRYRYMLNVNENDGERLQRLAKFWSTSCDWLIEPGETDAVTAAGDGRIKEIYAEGVQVLGQNFVQEVMHEKFFDALDRVMFESRVGRNSLGIKLDKLEDLTDLVNYWIYRNSSRISSARKMIREQKALKILCDTGIERAQSSAERAFNRLLDAYWLMKNTEIKTGRDLHPTTPKQTTSHMTLVPKHLLL
jgi:hypothetical protein